MKPELPYFEDLALGESPPDLIVGPLTTAHLMRWSSSTENWHKIHYDRPFSIEHDKLPDLLIHGSFKQQFLFRHLMGWLGANGWVWKVNFQFRAMNKVGETIRVWGRITELERKADYGLAHLEIGIENEAGLQSTPGSAVVAVRYKDGPPIAYPFVPPVS